MRLKTAILGAVIRDPLYPAVGLLLALCLLAAVTGTASPAQAQIGNPAPLRIVVVGAPGGTSDLVARMLAEALRTDLGRPIVVENRVGTNGRIAVDTLKSATPDGTTMLLAPIAVAVIYPLVWKDLGYDPVRDIVPVAQVATYEMALAVAAQHPARNLAEFVDWVKANPSQATYGTVSTGALPHFAGTIFAQAAGVALLHVPYGGAGAVQASLLGGQIAAAVSASSDFLALHRAGSLRILATSGSQRSRLLPDVPTFREQGFASVQATGWHGIFAPPKTPQSAIDQLSAAVSNALRTPAVRDRMIALGVEPTPTTPEAFAGIIAADTEYWRRVIKATGFTTE
jgi:tripartite-type tricarboxylate transporter receptor subunit TctC